MAPHRPPFTGRYLRIHQLGIGFFGEVWLARDQYLDVDVAIKYLDPAVNVGEVLLESQLLERLRAHDQVANIRDVQLGPPGPFIVMQYYPNGSVGQRLDASDVDLKEAVRWTRDGLAGLAHAHSLGVLHRDIKPDNLLLDDHRRAVLSDFGIAEDAANGLLLTNLVYQLHAAPELASSGSSEQTDIWAMGCTLYRLLTGTRPFEDLLDIGIRVPTDVHHLTLQIPLRLSRVVRKALASDPTDRYQSANAMLSDLAACPVHCSWESTVANLPQEEIWQTIRGGNTYELSIRQRSNGYRVLLRIDRGHGLRQVLREDVPTEARATAVRTRVLRAIIEDRAPG